MKHGESLSLYVITNELACSIRFGAGRVYGEFEKPDREFIEYVPVAQLETEREVLRDVKREAEEIIESLEARLAALQDAAREIWVMQYGDGWSRRDMNNAIDELEALLP